MIPKIRIRRLLLKLKLKFLVINITENIVRVAIKNLQKTNAKGVIYCKPIFMEGKEVPHKKPAKIVKSTAFFLVFAPS